RIDTAVPDRALDRDQAGQGQRLDIAADDEVRIDRRSDPFRIAQVHLLAADADVQIAWQISVEADAATKLDLPPAHRRRDVVETDAGWIEANRAVDGVERIGQREVADAAAGDCGASGKHWIVEW